MPTQALQPFTSIHTVLSLPELLTTILLYLPNRELLVSCTRVSHNFHAIITTSPLLLQKLFFAPTPIPPITTNLKTKATTTPLLKYNPLLVLAFPYMFPDLITEGIENELHREREEEERLEELKLKELKERLDTHPGFEPPQALQTPEERKREHERRKKLRRGVVPWHEELRLEKHDAYARKEASWRRMYPVSTPQFGTGGITIQVSKMTSRTSLLTGIVTLPTAGYSAPPPMKFWHDLLVQEMDWGVVGSAAAPFKIDYGGWAGKVGMSGVLEIDYPRGFEGFRGLEKCVCEEEDRVGEMEGRGGIEVVWGEEVTFEETDCGYEWNEHEDDITGFMLFD